MSVTLKAKIEIASPIEGSLLLELDDAKTSECLKALQKYEMALELGVKKIVKPHVDIKVTAWIDDNRNRNKPEKSHFDKILELVREDIKESEEQARRAGVKRLTPRIVNLKRDLGLIECGMSRAIPYEWDKRYSKQLDNEWEEYKRLHEKFSGERI
jgi:hypothetical protein